MARSCWDSITTGKTFSHGQPLDRRESPGVRDLPHSHPLSRDAAVPPNGIGGAPVASRLDSVRHGARRVSSAKHVTRGVGTRLCLDVRTPLLTRFDLAAPPRRLAR